MVMPAKAGIQRGGEGLDSRLRGNDEGEAPAAWSQRHACARRHPGGIGRAWIPASAGMTKERPRLLGASVMPAEAGIQVRPGL